MKKSCLLLALSLLIFQCDKNPFSSSEISPENKKIKGTISLENGANPEGTYVWLEQYNISTRADRNGNFTLEIPPSLRGSSANGTFTVYFFMANYMLSSAKVAIRNDTVIYGEEDVTGKGVFRTLRPIAKFLNITTSTIPQRVSRTSAETIIVTTELSAVSDSVTVLVPNSYPNGPLGILFIREIETENIFVFHSLLNYETPDRMLVTITPHLKILTFNFANFPLPVGTYEMIPFLYPSHQELPQGLMESFGEYALQPGIFFLNIPFNREFTIFEVIE